MFVKPAPGLLLRDPVTKQLLSAEPIEGIATTVVPTEGMQVDDNDLYWARRVRDGDAVRVAPQSTQTASKSAAAVTATTAAGSATGAK
jgi:Protein of unknown function (DUF2635)